MVKIASVQLDLGAKPSLILQSIKKYLLKAKKKKVDIVCFPEDTLNEGPKKNELILKKISNECKLNNISCIVAGNIKESGKVYNTAIIIDSKGRISGKHKKVHICEEGYHVHAGATFEVFTLDSLQIGLAICWDVNHPETIHTLARKGAKIVFCPMYWNYGLWSHARKHLHYEKKILKSLVHTRAYENLIYVVFCNPYNPKHSTLTPYSAIAEPHKIIKEIFNKEGMIEAEIDLEYLERIREKYRNEYNKIIQ